MKQTALITGASGGLGEEFAKLMAKDKINLVLVARSADRLNVLKKELEKTHGVSIQVYAVDLSLPDAAQGIVDRLKKDKITIDMLVNNAGFGEYGMFQTMDATRITSMIALNVSALTLLTRLLLPAMIKRKRGRVLNVASTAAFQPGPLMSVYYATKAYVLSFTEAIAQEVEGTGVSVTCLCPGPTKTGFEAHAHLQTSRLFKRKLMRPVDVATAGYRGMLRGKKLVIPGLQNRMGAFATRFASISLAAKIAKRVQAPG